MSMLPPLQKENADEKARCVRLLRIWTDICAMALCEMPDGRSERMITAKLLSNRVGSDFIVSARHSDETRDVFWAVSSIHPDAEDKLADIQRRLKPYVA
jgi:hypothetical protein